MANGFFLGGAAEGMADADKRSLARETLTADTDIRQQGLGLQGRQVGVQERAQTLAEKNAERTASQQGAATVDKHIADTMAVVGETVKSALAAGRDPAIVQKAITPLVESAKRIAAASGKDPAALDAQVVALLANPTAVESEGAKAEGKAVGEVKGAIAGAKAREAAGVPDENGGFKSKDEKIKAENSLRDDYLKNANNFATVRDAKNRLDNLEKTGAGDMTLVFQFMKMLDPGSTVREGEYATAANSGGVPSAVQGLYNKALGEGTIGTKARTEILGQANKIYGAAAGQHDKTTTQFANIAKRQGLNVDNVIIDMKPGAAPPPIAGTTPGGIGWKVSK